MIQRGAAPAFRRVEVVANVASGGVAPDAPVEIEKIFADIGIHAHVCAPSTEDLTNCLRAAVDAGPDLLVVLAGDGTVRAAAELCGPKGPMIAPLPGGTMNMLPHAVYGLRSWQDALTAALAEGEEKMLGGGEVEGRHFLVAAILGSPALWGPAREAARYGKARLALLRAQRALQRAFTGRLRYSLDDAPRDKAVGLSFLCPRISQALDEEAQALEAAVLDLQGLRDVVSLGFHALTGDWRAAPAVQAKPCRLARVWAAEQIPAILDGEAVRLSSSATIAFRPDIVRVLSLPKALREVMIRLAHLSDLHFGGENGAAVAAARAYINAGGFDLTVISGDLTRYGAPAEFAAAAAWLEGLRGPRMVTPGNHDAPYFAVPQRVFAPFYRFVTRIGPADAQGYVQPGLAVRGVNTARGAQPRMNWSKGQIARRQVVRTIAAFGRVPADDVRIVVCHHPLAEMIGGPMTARVWGGQSAARAFAEAGVDLVLSGHIHAPFAWPYPYADGRTYAVGAGTLSVRERGVPPGFNLVEIERAAFRVAALAWTGSHFEPYRTWSLDRR